MSESNPEKLVKINRVYPPDLETRHANNIVVQHEQDNFFLSFFAIDSIDARCVARIVLSPTRAKELIELLNQNIQMYESRFILKRDSETE